MSASRSPTDAALCDLAAPRRAYVRRRSIARLATLGSLLIAGWLIYLMVRVLNGPVRPVALILWMLLAAHVALSAVVLWRLWSCSKAARPSPLTTPGEDVPERGPHLGLSGQIEPPKRW